MKKVLLATTMLVAGASIAAAEVTLSGDARMGVISNYDDAATATNEGDLNFTSRARVTFNLSAESDSGLSFGASFRADNAGPASTGTGGSVFVSGAFGKLSMGDVDGAAKAAVGQVDSVGLTGLGDLNEITYIAAGGFEDPFSAVGFQVTGDPTALYEYSAGSFTAYVSVTNPGFTDEGIAPPPVWEGMAYAVGGKYSLGDYTVALGYEKLDASVLTTGAAALDAKNVVLGVSGTFSGVTVKGVYSRGSEALTATDFDQYALSATYTADALGVTAFMSNATATVAGAAAADERGLGLGVSYDLGGGATIKGGVARYSDKLAGVSDTAFDLGVALSF